MNILHYALGFPPYRSGGLTKYVTDLMQAQLGQGDKVALLWPGSYGMIRHDSWIEQNDKVNGIDSYELHNPLPVPLMDGIQDVPRYMKKGNAEVYRIFLERLRPDILHVHTLMGLHREFFEAAAALAIPIVYTAHDYFPICPKVTLFCNGKVCSGMGTDCVNCNQNALPFWKIVILQSGLYRELKDSKLIQTARKNHKKNHIEQESQNFQHVSAESADIYEELETYYRDCLSYASCIHYGSSLTKEQYEKRNIKFPCCVIPVTHEGIRDCRTEKKPHAVIQLAFLADVLPYKGFAVLCDALDELWEKEVHQFALHIYSRNQIHKPYIVQHPPYKHEELDEILKEIDMVLVPSLWEETFGLVVLEAISHGIPVLVSENVGARELIMDHRCPKGIVVSPDKEHIKNAVLNICREPGVLEMFSNNIYKDEFSYGLEAHYRKIKELYSKLQKEKDL